MSKAKLLESAFETKTILDFSDYRNYLKYRFLEMKKKKTGVSLEFMARRIGVTRSFVNLVLNGKRHIGLDMIFRFASFFSFSLFEFQYFFFAAISSTVKDKEGKVYIETVLGSFKAISNRNKNNVAITSKTFALLDENRVIFHDWVLNAIICMSSIRGFKYEPKWLHKMLGGNAVLDISTVQAALVNLKSMSAGQELSIPYSKKNIYIDPHPNDPHDWQRFKVGLMRVAQAIDLKGKTLVHQPSCFQMYMLHLTEDDTKKLEELYYKFENDFKAIADNSKDGDRVVLLSNNFIRITMPDKN